MCWLRPVESDRNNMFFSKVGFLAFIAMVINCTIEMEHKWQKIDIVVAAAEKYLGVQDLTTSEELQSGLSSGSCPVVLPCHWHGAAADRVKILEWGSGFNWKDVIFLVPFSILCITKYNGFILLFYVGLVWFPIRGSCLLLSLIGDHI